MLVLIVIGAILYLVIKCNNLKAENFSLKQKLTNQNNLRQNQIKFCPHCGKSLINNVENNNIKEAKTNNEEIIIKEEQTKEDINQQFNQIDKKEPTKKIKYNETELKNSIILIIGAILVVLSAIVFLSSTWETTLNIEKVIIITAMFFVFLASSYIADEKLNVKKTSRIFLYIAYSYLPLVFFSLSLLNILGNYLSFYGPGKYIYLAISSIILSYIYYNNMKKENDIFFAIGGIIFQILSVTFLIAHISPTFNALLLGISIFTLIYNFLYNSKKIYYYNSEFHLKTVNILTITSIIITIYHRFFNILQYENNLVFIINLIIIYINSLYSIKKQKDNYLDFKLVSPLLITFICLELSDFINQGYLGYQICILFGIAIIFLTDHIYYETSNLESFCISSFSLIILYIYSFAFKNCIPSYILIIIYSLYVILFKYSNKDNRISEIVLNCILSLSICISIMDLSLSNSLNAIILTTIYLSIYVITSILIKDEKTKIPFTIIPSVFIISSYIIALFNNSNNLLLGTLALLIATIHLLFAFYQKQLFSRFISYIWLIPTITYFTLHLTDNISNLYYVLPCSIILSFIIDYLIFDDKNEYIRNLFTFEFCISYFSLMFINNPIAYILYILITLLLFIHIKENKINHYYYLIPIISFHYFLENQNLDIYKLLLLTYPITIALLYLYYSKKDNKYIVLSLVNVLITFDFGYINKYIKLLTLLVCFIVYYIVSEKDLWKAGTYILITMFIEEIVKDLNLQDVTVLTIGLYVLLFIIISRTIIKKHVKDFKILEYIILSTLYYVAIMDYPNELNGMLFVLLLLGLTLFGYNKKMGPIFLTSIIFILINVFLLTRMFWLTIPWWIYILIIGFILIAFATRNEIKESDKKNNIIKEISKDLDL